MKVNFVVQLITYVALGVIKSIQMVKLLKAHTVYNNTSANKCGYSLNR